MIGTDLDGVLAEHNKGDWIRMQIEEGKYSEETEKEIMEIWKRAEPKNRWIGEMSDVIITARPEEARELTERWLKRNNIQPDNLVMMPIKMRDMPTDMRVVCEWKTKVIKTLGISLYFEDLCDIIEYMRKNLPIKIVEVRS